MNPHWLAWDPMPILHLRIVSRSKQSKKTRKREREREGERERERERECKSEQTWWGTRECDFIWRTRTVENLSVFTRVITQPVLENALISDRLIATSRGFDKWKATPIGKRLDPAGRLIGWNSTPSPRLILLIMPILNASRRSNISITVLRPEDLRFR